VLFQCFALLQVRENEISLHKWSGGAARLRTLARTLIANIAFLPWNTNRTCPSTVNAKLRLAPLNDEKSHHQRLRSKPPIVMIWIARPRCAKMFAPHTLRDGSRCLERGGHLFLGQGSQTQIAPKAKWGLMK